jgi:phosphocarrier protein
MDNEAEINVVLTNKKGLHARAAAKFVKVAGQFSVKILVAKIAGAGVIQGAELLESSGGSILGLMMLGAECGSTLRLRIAGTQVDEASAELRKLVEGRFGEE